METKHLRIFGRVQGVGYRAWAHHQAELMRLSGWVRNRKDSSVEAVITGDAKDIQRFIEACYDGPALAKVETISINEEIAEDIEGFEIRDTL